MTIEKLEMFADAWNRHDIDALMSFMTEDCIFETGGGTEPCGEKIQGSGKVRERFQQVWQDVPDAHFINVKHFISANRGCSQWCFTGTAPDGSALRINGCDLFEFRQDKIAVKSTYLKQVS